MTDRADSDDPSRLIALDAFADPGAARLLGVVIALASEVFVLKAEVARLTSALEAQGTLGPDALRRQGETAALQDWMAREQRTFAAELLRPWLEPDAVADVRRFMDAE